MRFAQLRINYQHIIWPMALKNGKKVGPMGQNAAKMVQTVRSSITFFYEWQPPIFVIAKIRQFNGLQCRFLIFWFRYFFGLLWTLDGQKMGENATFSKFFFKLCVFNSEKNVHHLFLITNRMVYSMSRDSYKKVSKNGQIGQKTALVPDWVPWLNFKKLKISNCSPGRADSDSFFNFANRVQKTSFGDRDRFDLFRVPNMQFL